MDRNQAILTGVGVASAAALASGGVMLYRAWRGPTSFFLPENTPNDVARVVREANRAYAPSSETCSATKENLAPLMGTLRSMTDKISDEGIDSIPILAESSQVHLDFMRWKLRLEHYEDAVDAAPEGPAGCENLRRNVLMPLVAGYYPKAWEGLVLSTKERNRIIAGGFSNAKPPDMATPFTIGNQISALEQHRKRATDELVGELTAMCPGESAWFLGACVNRRQRNVGSGLVLAGIGGLWLRGHLQGHQTLAKLRGR